MTARSMRLSSRDFFQRPRWGFSRGFFLTDSRLWASEQCTASMQPHAAPSPLGPGLPGALGLGADSLGAYGVWAFAGKALSHSLGEGGFYALLVAVFVGLTGLALPPLVAGPRS